MVSSQAKAFSLKKEQKKLRVLDLHFCKIFLIWDYVEHLPGKLYHPEC